MKFDLPYPCDSAKFRDEGGEAIKKKPCFFLLATTKASPPNSTTSCPRSRTDFTKARLARWSQSIEAFVNCVLSGQVNVRNSTLGTNDRVLEVQREFLVLLEDTIRQPELTKCYQLQAIVEAKGDQPPGPGSCPRAW